MSAGFMSLSLFGTVGAEEASGAAGAGLHHREEHEDGGDQAS